MIVGMGDTHAVIWYLFGDKRLSTNAQTFINTTATNGDEIAVSAITLVAIIYLIERQKIAAETYQS